MVLGSGGLGIESRDGLGGAITTNHVVLRRNLVPIPFPAHRLAMSSILVNMRLSGIQKHRMVMPNLSATVSVFLLGY
jgi:hypothetical protein